MAPILPTGHILLRDALVRVRQARFPDVREPAGTSGTGTMAAIARGFAVLAHTMGEPHPWFQAIKDSETATAQELADARIKAWSIRQYDGALMPVVPGIWTIQEGRLALASGYLGSEPVVLLEAALEAWLRPPRSPSARPAQAQADADLWLRQHQQQGFATTGEVPTEKAWKAANDQRANPFTPTQLTKAKAALPPELRRSKGEHAAKIKRDRASKSNG